MVMALYFLLSSHLSLFTRSHHSPLSLQEVIIVVATNNLFCLKYIFTVRTYWLHSYWYRVFWLINVVSLRVSCWNSQVTISINFLFHRIQMTSILIPYSRNYIHLILIRSQILTDPIEAQEGLDHPLLSNFFF